MYFYLPIWGARGEHSNMILDPSVPLDNTFPPSPSPHPQRQSIANLGVCHSQAFIQQWYLQTRYPHLLKLRFRENAIANLWPGTSFHQSPSLTVSVETYQVIKCVSDETSLTLPLPIQCSSQIHTDNSHITEFHSLNEYLSLFSGPLS